MNKLKFSGLWSKYIDMLIRSSHWYAVLKKTLKTFYTTNLDILHNDSYYNGNSSKLYELKADINKTWT